MHILETHRAARLLTARTVGWARICSPKKWAGEGKEKVTVASVCRLFQRLCSHLWLAFAAGVAMAHADGSTNRFAFTGPEIYPIDNQIGHLRAADLDGDGLQDLIVVNNFR